jgi:hypothetical protein
MRGRRDRAVGPGKLGIFAANPGHRLPTPAPAAARLLAAVVAGAARMPLVDAVVRFAAGPERTYALGSGGGVGLDRSPRPL